MIKNITTENVIVHRYLREHKILNPSEHDRAKASNEFYFYAKKYVLKKLATVNLDKDCSFKFNGNDVFESLYDYMSYFMNAKRISIYLKSMATYDWFNDKGRKKLRDMSKLIDKVRRLSYLK